MSLAGFRKNPSYGLRFTKAQRMLRDPSESLPDPDRCREFRQRSITARKHWDFPHLINPLAASGGTGESLLQTEICFPGKVARGNVPREVQVNRQHFLNSGGRFFLYLKMSMDLDPVSLFLFFFFIFYFFERDGQSVDGGGAEREGDTESDAGCRLRAVSTEPDAGLEPTDLEITT